MRILIKTRFGQLIIKEVSEATINEDGDIVFPKSGEKYLTGENAEEVFKSLQNLKWSVTAATPCCRKKGGKHDSIIFKP